MAGRVGCFPPPAARTLRMSTEQAIRQTTQVSSYICSALETCSGSSADVCSPLITDKYRFRLAWHRAHLFHGGVEITSGRSCASNLVPIRSGEFIAFPSKRIKHFIQNQVVGLMSRGCLQIQAIAAFHGPISSGRIWNTR